SRLGDSGVTDRNSGRDFPTQQIKREIPWRNQSGDAAWLTQCVIKRDGVGDMRFRFRVQNRRGKESEVRNRAWDVECAGERNWLASIDRFGARESLQCQPAQTNKLQA